SVRQRVPFRLQVQARSVSSFSEWRDVLGAIAVRNCIRHVHESLCRLSNWNRRYHLIAQSVDCDGLLAVLQCDVDSGTISRWPNSVRKVSYGNRGDQLRRRRSETPSFRHRGGVPIPAISPRSLIANAIVNFKQE